MINYEILNVDNVNHLVEIRYTKEDQSIPFFVSINIPKGFDEETIHGIAKDHAWQACKYWENTQDIELEKEPFIITEAFGEAKPTLWEAPPSYSAETQAITPVVVENEDHYLRTFEVRDYTDLELSEMLRGKRDFLLEQTDKFAMADRTINPDMINYRQALRDLTDQPEFPRNVTWPIKPVE